MDHDGSIYPLGMQDLPFVAGCLHQVLENRWIVRPGRVIGSMGRSQSILNSDRLHGGTCVCAEHGIATWLIASSQPMF